MFKRYAYYEKSSTGWGLVVYHDHKPGKSVNSADPERVGPYEVPQEMIDVYGTPNLGLITKAFPAPFHVASNQRAITVELSSLTKRQRELYEQLQTDGFIPHRSGFGTSQQNRPLWHLVECGLAEFDWGPRDSALRVQGFLPVRGLPDAVWDAV